MTHPLQKPGPAFEQTPPARPSTCFVCITALFITSLLTANIMAAKLIELWGLILPAAIVIFPVSYIVGDVLTEVYGYAAARRVIWLGFFCNFLMVLALMLGGTLPAAPFWTGQEAYERILGFTPRVLAASFLAYLVGEFCNAYVMAKLKVYTKGRWLWTRTIGSTLLGQGLDSMVFISVAFWGIMPPEALLGAVTAQWLVKASYEALATPITYSVVAFLKRREGLDVYDTHTRFHPLWIR